jgi:hypothetical protein
LHHAAGAAAGPLNAPDRLSGAAAAKWNFAARPVSNAIILRTLVRQPACKKLEIVVHLSSGLHQTARRTLVALVCAAAFLAAGCHRNNNASGYGIAWVTLTDSPGDFTSYIVNINSITLTRNDGNTFTALATPETVDFTKLSNYAELWGTATIPTGTYTSASIVLDYTNAFITVMVDGLPQRVDVFDTAGAAVTTVTLNVILDPANPLVLTPTFATTDAKRLALDFNLAASTAGLAAASPPQLYVRPYVTAAIAKPDNKLIRVRGPLINSSVDLLTYTVYIRPFFDEVDSLGALTIFTDANTIFSTNGIVSTGATGLTQLSQSSAGTTVTAAFTTFQPTATPSAVAGIYTAKYVIAGSTLEDVYTQGIEGDVVARTGNTVTLRGATIQLNSPSSIYGNYTVYNTLDAVLLLGPGTTVTADGDTALTGLNYNSVAVGQHVIARGIYSLAASGVATLDATGTEQTNTGSVRLISTNLWGSLVSSAAGNLLLNVQTINNWPIADFSFAGNGSTAASDPTGANFLVNTGAIAIPDTTVGDSLFIAGTVAPFGSAPPDFNATSVNDELSVQQIGAVAPSATCGQGSTLNALSQLACTPASLRVVWTGTGTSTPFTGLSGTGFAIDLANANYGSGEIRIGPESIDLKSLAASPQVIATVAAAATTATAPGTGAVPQSLTPVFLPEYSFGNPLAVAPAGISVFSAFGTFATGLTTALATTPAVQLEARGTFDRATNTFTAMSVNVVL